MLQSSYFPPYRRWPFMCIDPHQKVEIRMVPDRATNLTEIRFWANGKLTDTQKIKNQGLRSLNY